MIISRHLLSYILLSSILLTSNSLFSQNISGVWQGVLTQENGSQVLSNSYAFWLSLQQNGTEIVGHARIEVANTTNFAVIYLDGSCNNQFFGFAERGIFTEHFDSSGFQWCMIAAMLNVENNDSELNGTWHANEACGTGKLNLVRSSAPFNFNMYQTNTYISFNDLKKSLKNGEVLSNKKIILENLQFEANSAEISEGSKNILDRLLQVLEKNNDLRIKIQGHTDNTGDGQVNLRLSVNRAKAVAKYLMDHGISEERLQTEGFAASRPLGDNATEEGRAKNRRTEIQIL